MRFIMKLIFLIMVAVVLTACGAGKATVSADKETTGLTKAEIDTIQHDAARLAMESGEFVFIISRAIMHGRTTNPIPRTNYLEVTDGKWFFQLDMNPKKNAKRNAGKVMDTRFECDSSSCRLVIEAHNPTNPYMCEAVLTLYPGSNRASGDLLGWWGMKIEGVIVPRKVANIARIAPPSFAEERDAW